VAGREGPPLAFQAMEGVVAGRGSPLLEFQAMEGVAGREGPPLAFWAMVVVVAGRGDPPLAFWAMEGWQTERALHSHFEQWRGWQAEGTHLLMFNQATVHRGGGSVWKWVGMERGRRMNEKVKMKSTTTWPCSGPGPWTRRKIVTSSNRVPAWEQWCHEDFFNTQNRLADCFMMSYFYMWAMD